MYSNHQSLTETIEKLRHQAQALLKYMFYQRSQKIPIRKCKRVPIAQISMPFMIQVIFPYEPYVAATTFVQSI